MLPENSYVSRVGYYRYSTFNHDGSPIDGWKSAIKVSFGYNLDGYDIIGPGAKASVAFGDQGRIVEAHRLWRDIEPDEEKAVLPFDEALNSFKENWPTEAEPQVIDQADTLTEVSINEVYLAYYAETACEPQSRIEPVYVFNGNYNILKRDENGELSGCSECGDDFRITVPATS
jgi:hypothetical protein